MSVKQSVKSLFQFLNLPVTKNLRYDIYTRRILKKVLKADSNCIDIGCHKGDILDEILKYAPDGKHWGFEPLTFLFKDLEKKYRGRNISLSQVALCDKKGMTKFHHVVNAPAYSGIRKRKYDIPDAQVDELTVETDILDNIIPSGQKIDFIKIDVEGAEFSVLKGGKSTICRWKPLMIFEFGLGAAEYYNSKPEDLHNFLTKECSMCISTLKGFLNEKKCLERKDFCELFVSGKEYYFVAWA
jgi:FkbM family methyltransferase